VFQVVNKTALTKKKNRSNYGYKPLSKRGTHARYSAVQRPKKSPIEYENKRNVFGRMFDGLQIVSKTIKQRQTRQPASRGLQGHISDMRSGTNRPNGKMLGHQNMFDDIWSTNISRLLGFS